MKITLKAVAGPLKGKAFSFQEYKKICIGRSPGAYFSFPEDQRISRLHCVLEFVPPYNCYIKDLDSSNGTFYGVPNPQKKSVAFSKVSEQHAQNNHYLRVGETTFLICMEQKINALRKCQECGLAIRDDQFARGEASTFATKNYCANCKDKANKENMKIVADFQILRRLGEGSIGAVYLAKHIERKLSLALKIAHPSIQPQEQQIKRFLREAEYGAQIRHKNIVRYYKAGYSPEHGFFYIPMEYVPGIDLLQYLKNNGSPFTIKKSRVLILQIVDAIAHLHKHKILHRDIKPANIIVVDKKPVPLIKLADLGLAKKYEDTGLSGLTMSNKGMGTPDYLAPEQLENAKSVDERADIYSAAATIYQLLSYNTVFMGSSLRDIFSKIINEPPIPLREHNPTVSANLEKIIMLCLEKEPQKRIQTMQEFKVLLNRLLR